MEFSDIICFEYHIKATSETTDSHLCLLLVMTDNGCKEMFDKDR